MILFEDYTMKKEVDRAHVDLKRIEKYLRNHSHKKRKGSLETLTVLTVCSYHVTYAFGQFGQMFECSFTN